MCSFRGPQILNDEVFCDGWLETFRIIKPHKQRPLQSTWLCNCGMLTSITLTSIKLTSIKLTSITLTSTIQASLAWLAGWRALEGFWDCQQYDYWTEMRHSGPAFCIGGIYHLKDVILLLKWLKSLSTSIDYRFVSYFKLQVIGNATHCKHIYEDTRYKMFIVIYTMET